MSTRAKQEFRRQAVYEYAVEIANGVYCMTQAYNIQEAKDRFKAAGLMVNKAKSQNDRGFDCI